MTFSFKKLKESLDWVTHAKLVFDLGVAIVGFKGVHAMLMSTHVPSVWISPLEWSSGTVVFGLMLLITKKGSERSPISETPNLPIESSADSRDKQISSNALSRSIPHDPGRFDSQEFFRTAYYSTLQDVSANSFRDEAERVRSNDKASFYLDVLAVGSLAMHYDQIWVPLFRSQLRALLALNKHNGLSPLSDFQKFYDDAKEEFSTEYAQKPFDAWMKYLTANTLVKIHPSKMVEITLQGKDFLKYLLHWGRSEDTKRL